MTFSTQSETKRRKRPRPLVVVFVLLCVFGIWYNSPLAWSFRYRHYYALVDAIDRNDYEATKVELERGTNPNKNPGLDSEGYLAPLSLAATKGNTQIVTLLLDHKADPNIWDGWNFDPFTAAAKNDHLSVVKILVARAGIPCDDRAILTAVEFHAPNITQYVLKQGADPNAYDTRDKKTVLQEAEENHDERIVALLKKAGAHE